jgi:hypothetical protein
VNAEYLAVTFNIGSIFLIDFNNYAMHQTVQQGATIVVRNHQNSEIITVLNDLSVTDQ